MEFVDLDADEAVFDEDLALVDDDFKLSRMLKNRMNGKKFFT